MPGGRRTHSQREIPVGDFRGRESIFGGQIGSEDNGEGETPRQRPRWLMSPRIIVLRDIAS